MMRKSSKTVFLLILFIFIFIGVAYSGGDSDRYDDTDYSNGFGEYKQPHMEVAPYNGAYGVPLGSPHYEGGDFASSGEGFYDDKGVWHPTYSDNEIICIGSAQGILPDDYEEKYKNEQFIATVTCPNGLYFVSQSNPAFKRPFELMLVFKRGVTYEKGHYQAFVGWTDWEKGSVQTNLGEETISNENNEPIPVNAGDLYEGIKDISGNSYRNQIASIWCDIILILPGEIAPGTDTLIYDGTEYPLVEADDYTALVTIDFKFGDLSDSIAIPFSGFYERDDINKRSGTCSLLIQPTSEAAHLSIANDRGNWVTVGTLDFLLSTYHNSKNSPVIFASSSSDPRNTNAKEFRMVHDSVTFNTPLTNTNSIPYTVRIQRTGTAGTPQAIFDGTGNINQVIASESFGIHPEVTPAVIQHADNLTFDQSSSGMKSDAAMDYYGYEGNIDVMLEPGTNVMKAGRYTGTVYIHVVADDGGGTV